jgi:Xaa-Pro aminopeptidase
VSADRLDRVRAQLEERRLDALLITTPSNRRWVSGFTGSAGVVLVTRDRARFATDSRYWEQIGLQAPGFELVKVAGATTGVAPEILEGTGGMTVGYEPAHLTVASYEQWTGAIDGMLASDRPRFVPAPGLIEGLRIFKDADELDALARAVRLGDEGMEHAISIVEPGMTEKQLAWEIQRYVMEHGADNLSFNTIIAGGDWGASPHAYPRDVPLPANAGVVIDMGVIVDGYCSDLTRTLFLGEPDDQFRRVYDTVLTAQMTAEERIEAGMTGREAHQIAATVIAEAGYGEYFGHGLGHGVGLDIHEAPRLAPGSDAILEDGQVFTVEPGIYIPGWGGVRIEDQCVMEDGRVRAVSASPKLDLEIGVRS